MEATERIAAEVKQSAYEIISKKGATYYGIAMSVKRICEAIIRDEKSILPISTMLHGEYGISDVVLSLPCIVGRDGYETKVPIDQDQEEVSKLHESANTLKRSSFGVLCRKLVFLCLHFLEERGRIPQWVEQRRRNVCTTPFLYIKCMSI